MSNDSSNDIKNERPDGAHNFMRIRGISPKIAARLHEAGILTFEKLAAMTPSEIVARIGPTSGISAELIAKKDWSGQAAALLAKTKETRSESSDPDNQGGQHSVSYIVQFTLDEHRHVKSTKVHHVQSGDEKSWENWDAAKLIGFFTKRPELSLSQEPQTVAIPQTSATVGSQLPASESKKLPITVQAPTGAIHLRQVEVVPETTNAPSWGLQHSQPFYARVNVDLSQVSGLPKDELEYTATFKARGLGDAQIHTIGETQGTLMPDTSITLNAKGNLLPQGFYRVFASVTLNPLEQTSMSAHKLIASVEGNLLEIY